MEIPCFVALLTSALVIAWMVAEFRGSKAVRISLGLVTLSMSFAIAAATASIIHLQYDVEFGGAAANMIDSILERLDEGDHDRLASDLIELRKNVGPSYHHPPFEDSVAEFLRSDASRPDESPDPQPTDAS